MSLFGVPGHLLRRGRVATRRRGSCSRAPRRLGRRLRAPSSGCDSSPASCGHGWRMTHRCSARLVISLLQPGALPARGDPQRGVAGAFPSRVVVVDDGSTDDTAAVAARFAACPDGPAAEPRAVGGAEPRARRIHRRHSSSFSTPTIGCCPGPSTRRRARCSPSGLRHGLRPLRDDGARRRLSGRRRSNAASSVRPSCRAPPHQPDLDAGHGDLPPGAAGRRRRLHGRRSTDPPTTTSTCGSHASIRFTITAARRRLPASLGVHERQCQPHAARHAGGDGAATGRDDDEAQLEAWRDGYRNWQDFYGTQLVEEIRLHVRGGESAAAMRKSLRWRGYAPGRVHAASWREEDPRHARIRVAARAPEYAG